MFAPFLPYWCTLRFVNLFVQGSRVCAAPIKLYCWLLILTLILMIWSPCHSILVLISSLSLKCQGHPTKGPLTKIFRPSVIRGPWLIYVLMFLWTIYFHFAGNECDRTHCLFGPQCERWYFHSWFPGRKQRTQHSPFVSPWSLWPSLYQINLINS